MHYDLWKKNNTIIHYEILCQSKLNDLGLHIDLFKVFIKTFHC